jgi:hypothetical protein
VDVLACLGEWGDGGVEKKEDRVSGDSRRVLIILLLQCSKLIK